MNNVPSCSQGIEFPICMPNSSFNRFHIYIYIYTYYYYYYSVKKKKEKKV